MKNMQSLFLSKNSNIKQIFLYLISLILIVSLIYYFILSLNFYNFISFLISFVISYLMSNFVLNKFKFSNNRFIKFLQKFIIINLIIIVGILVFNYFNINLITEVSYSNNDAPFRGGELKNVKSENKITFTGTMEDIKTGKQYYVPSPDNTFVNCPLEPGDEPIPLVDLLQALFSLNLLEIFIIAILILIVFNRYFYKFNMGFISKLVSKYLPDNYPRVAVFKKYTKNSIEYNNKFTTIMFILLSVLLILVKLGNLYVTIELNNNIEDYVLVYHYLKYIKKGSILIIGLPNNFLIKNINNINNKTIIRATKG